MTPPTSIPQLFASMSLAQAQPQALAQTSMPWAAQVVVALVAVVCAALWLVERGRSQRLRAEQARTARALSTAVSKGKSVQHPGLEAAKSALKSAEIALAAQKKKNFSQNEQLLAAQATAKEAASRASEAIADAQRAHRAAEAALVKNAAAAPKPSRHKPEARPQAQPEPRAAAEPPSGGHAPQDAAAHEPAETPSDGPAAALAPEAAANATPPEPEKNPEVQALTEALSAAQAAYNDGEALRLALQAELKEARREAGRKNKRIEDLRRVDLMSRGKIEVLEDKVRRLGRELYESISVLAQMRGEVGPVPGPKKAPASAAAPALTPAAAPKPPSRSAVTPTPTGSHESNPGLS